MYPQLVKVFSAEVITSLDAVTLNTEFCVQCWWQMYASTGVALVVMGNRQLGQLKHWFCITFAWVTLISLGAGFPVFENFQRTNISLNTLDKRPNPFKFAICWLTGFSFFSERSVTFGFVLLLFLVLCSYFSSWELILCTSTCLLCMKCVLFCFFLPFL